MPSGEIYLRLKPYLVVKIASDVLTEHCCQVCVLAMIFCRSDCRLCAGMCGKWLRNHGKLLDRQRATCFGLLTLRQANMGYEKYSLHLIFTFYHNRKIGARIIPCRCISIKKILRVDSSRRARDTAAMLDHSRRRGESATKTVKFFVAHTVNCVMGLKFEKSFCAVDRLSCQFELSKSETSQFRSDLVFDIVNYMHVIFLHGG